MKGKRKNEVHQEENLTDIIERYRGDDMSPEEKAAFKVIREAAVPSIPATSYIRTNAIFLKNLFTKIERKYHVTHEELVSVYRPLILGALERFYEDMDAPLHPFAGAWFKVEDVDDPYSVTGENTIISNTEILRLEERTLRPDASGPEFAFALSLFAGLTAREAMSARYRDIAELEEYPGCYMLHTMGEFPKRTMATDFDPRPRWVPLSPKLANAIIERREAASKLDFPITGPDGFGGDIHISGVGDLPIACAPGAPQEHLHLSDLADTATKLLLDAGVHELTIASREDAMLRMPALFRAERSAAYYLARATYATWMFCAAFPEGRIKSVLGHLNEEGRYVSMTEAEMFECIRTLGSASWMNF